MPRISTERSPRRLVLLVLFFLSGAAALIYEVLWLKELGLLFGVTAYAASTTLAVFFLGLSAGSLTWGRRSNRIRRPLRLYAWLEVAIAFSACLYFLLLNLYRQLFPWLFQSLGHSPQLFLVAKFALAFLILFPPAFFMGGTLPVMGQYLIRSRTRLGTSGAALYAVNTFGGALGAMAAGLYLPLMLGYRGSYLVAIGLNLGIAGITFWWSAGEMSHAGVSASTSAIPLSSTEVGKAHAGNAPGLWALAFSSGFLALALEVLWTRMFAQVLQNSVYTFTVILAVFLVALAGGSVVAHFLARRNDRERTTLFTLLLLAGLAVGLTPLSFDLLTSGLDFLAGDLGWTGYLAAVFSGAAAILLVPGILIGSVFPFLLKLSERTLSSPGETIGRLVSINTIGAIAGSIVAGFVLLEIFGLWISIGLVAGVYLLLSISVGVRGGGVPKWLAAGAPTVGILLLVAILGGQRLAQVSLDDELGEELVALREGAHGTVALVRRGEDLRLKVNNSYLLGTSASTPNLRLQSWIPLSLHRQPNSVFFLGMGTGITAGGALDFPVERVIVTELNPDVVTIDRTYFAPFLNGLFEDSRVKIVTEDGRTYLSGTRERFDAIIADIFLTYKAGSGSLYTREHYETIRSRLAPGGLFAQWLPMFELSRREFGIIARTMLEVFPQVTLWRRGFSPSFPVFALIARNESEPLDRGVLHDGIDALAGMRSDRSLIWYLNVPLTAYAGNVHLASEVLETHPVATDDRPLIEYFSPVTNRENWGAGRVAVLAWLELAEFCQEILKTLPPANDPYLSWISAGEQDQVLAGLSLYSGEVLRRLGHEEEADEKFVDYHRLLKSDEATSPFGGQLPAEDDVK